jgi:DNA-binding winged helix-turn-helix (wHTH) protein/tetratricopeptide (TPR) repeat protein
MGNERLIDVVRFGSFELHLRSGELYSEGRKVHLQEQPFQILKLLTDCAGELVTREEIRRRLWPNDTVVEFGNAVNAAIKKLRIALGDSAEEQRFIETLKGRGYRLIVPVEGVATGAADPVSADVEPPGMPVPGLAAREASHYRVLDIIGGGGMGVVYRGEDMRLGRQVALKFLTRELASRPIALERLRLEACSASALNHPNICTIYEIEEHAGEPFIVMELLEGSTLRDRISGPSLSAREVLDYAFQIVEGLDAAHRRGIVHRDIKPANIFVTKQERVKILDFGLAHFDSERSRRTEACALATRDRAEGPLASPGDAPGTDGYRSPEQALGKPLDARTDLFSFGLVLREMATGTEVSPGLERIVSKCLQNDPELRYRHAAEIRADLQLLKGGTERPLGLGRAMAKRRMPIVPAAAAVLALCVAGYFYFHRKPKLTDKDTIVLADFINTTGDPVFDGTLRQGLAVQLEQSPFLSLISDQRMQRTLRLMGRPADARLSPQLAKEICERTAGAAVLDGSIASVGNQYVLGLRARNCRTGEVMDEEQAQAERKEDVLQALSRIASRFRSRVGESLATVQGYDTPLAEATTLSLEALKAYSAAWGVVHSSGAAAALPLFRRATEIDPAFAMAHAWLGRMYDDLDEFDLSAESTRRAWQLRDRASDGEKFFIAASYDMLVTGNMEAARQTCEAWARTYPREAVPHGMLSGMINKAGGRYEKAAAEARKAIELSPDFAIWYYNLAVNLVYLGRLEEAEHALRSAAGLGLEIDEFVMLEYDIAFLRADQGRMERAAVWARGRSGGENWIPNKEALALAYSGGLQQARSMSRRAVDQAQHAAQPERAGLWEAGAAVRQAFFGNASEARRRAMAALELSRNREVKYGAAFALALSGDSSRSQMLANDLEKRFGEDTCVRFSYLPALRARLALNGGEPAKAIEMLQVAVPFELGAPRSSISGNFGALYPVYVRGEAYLAARRGAEAAAEFQKILDHRGIVVSDPIGALARLQLGRALVLSGDGTKAKTAYRDFLTLWKDADPDIPILKQAKAEYAKLLPGSRARI